MLGLVFMALLPSPVASGQTTVLLNSSTNGTTVSNACAHYFYDSGGSGSNYGNNQNFTITFCAPAGETVRMDFLSFAIASGDNLSLYDGASTASTLIGTYQATSPDFVFSTGTCMTVKFTSNSSGTASGWFATVTCRVPIDCVDNLLTNGSFDTNTDGWTATNGVISVQSSYQMDGPRILWLQRTSGTANVRQQVNGILPNKLYRLRFYAGTHEPSFTHQVNLRVYNSSNAQVAISTVNVEHDVDIYYELEYYETTVTTPASASYIIVEGTATGDYLKFDGVCLTTCTVSAANNSPICAGAALNMTSAAVNTVGTVSYAWAGPSSFSSASQNPSRSNATTGMSGTYTVTITDGMGCTATGTTSATVVADPSVTAQPSSGSTCIGGSEDLSVTAAGGTPSLTYQWQYYDGSSWANVSNGTPAGSTYANPTTANLTASGFTSAGGYQYRVLVNASGAGCTQAVSSTATITVSANPVANNGGPYCPGQTIQLTGSPSGMSAYAWSGPNNWTSVLQSPSIELATAAMAGVYTLTVTASSGCTASASTTVSVLAAPLKPGAISY